MLLRWIYIHVGPHTCWNKLNQRLWWAFKVPWSSGFVFGLSPRGGFGESSEWPWNMIHLMPCTNQCRFDIHLTCTYFVGPLSLVWSNLGPAPPFPPMRVLEVYGHGLSVSCVKWPLKCTSRGPKGQFTHKTEGTWPLQSKSSHWSKGRRPSKEDFMDEKSTWSPTWRTRDKVSWSPGIFVRPTSKRWA